MRFCFIVEEAYRHDPMPMVVVYQLLQWGHSVDVLEPQEAAVCLTDTDWQSYDAYVLKTLAEGPGLSILEAAEAMNIPTINHPQAIRLVRDKAVAAAFARAHRLPVPPTYFAAHPGLLDQIPLDEYPLVIKPSNGSSCRDIYRVDTPAQLQSVQAALSEERFLLAQHYVENTGFDIKVYVTGKEVYAAVARKSPLHSEVEEVFIPLSKPIRKLALEIGALFGLDIYGIDIVEGPNGPMVLDINDFPSFGGVPRAVIRVAEYILHAAQRAEMRRRPRLRPRLPKAVLPPSVPEEFQSSNRLTFYFGWSTPILRSCT
jgi:ribosomal protein S6--L-glutamate ligase